MKAAVCRAFGEPMVIEELELAPPGANELKVKIKACAICHSDIHYAEGAWGGQLPAVYGHEAAGVVEEVGPGVRGIAQGDHVIVTLVRSCGRCPCCEQGFHGSCETKFHLDGASPLKSASGEDVAQGLRTGAFAEYVVVEASQVVPIPDDMPLDAAALLACGVITGFGAVSNTAQVRAGSCVVVVGTGGVGLNAVQGAALAGANKVIAVDLSEEKLEAAKVFGATDGVNPANGDAAQAVKQINNGRRADYVFVTVGAKAAVDGAYRMLAKGGALVLVGMPASGVKSEFEIVVLADASQRILGSKMGSSNIHVDLPKLVSLYKQGRLKLDELISGRFKLEEINEAIAQVNRGEVLRNIIVFD